MRFLCVEGHRGLVQGALLVGSASLAGCLLTLEPAPMYRPPAGDGGTIDVVAPPHDGSPPDDVADVVSIDVGQDVQQPDDVQQLDAFDAGEDAAFETGTGDTNPDDVVESDVPVDDTADASVVDVMVGGGDATPIDAGCPVGQTACIGGCRDLTSDPLNCGGCGAVCTSGACVGGVCDPGGDGAEGARTFSGTETTLAGSSGLPLSVGATAGSMTLRVVTAAPFTVNCEVLIIDVSSTPANMASGRFEFARVVGVDTTAGANALTLAAPLANSYPAPDHTEVVLVHHFSSLDVPAGINVTAVPWNGATGGIIAVRVQTSATIAGTLTANGGGFRGGASVGSPSSAGSCSSGRDGESYTALPLPLPAGPANNAGGGGGGLPCGCATSLGHCGNSSGGGGGSHATPGASGSNGGAASCGGGGAAGAAYDSAAAVPVLMHFGSGGGGGGGNGACPSGVGGSGGGIIFLAANSLTITGSIAATGVGGAAGMLNGIGGCTVSDAHYEGAGGSGAGGTLWLQAATATITTMTGVRAAGGGPVADGCAASAGMDGWGGAGGDGIIRIDCDTINGAPCTGPMTMPLMTTPAPYFGAYP